MIVVYACFSSHIARAHPRESIALPVNNSSCVLGMASHGEGALSTLCASRVTTHQRPTPSLYFP
jgi:hypothetical protein